MISYPGAVAARFGRYEAVEDRGRSGRGHLWRAWDPFLGRFVIVAALPGLDAAELRRNLTTLDQAFTQWLGASFRWEGPVLDFAPAGLDEPAFFVFSLPEDSAKPRHVPFAPPTASRRQAPVAALVSGTLLVLGAAGLWFASGLPSVGASALTSKLRELRTALAGADSAPTSVSDDDTAVRAALAAYARAHESQLRAQGIAGAVVCFDVIAITLHGNSAEARVSRTVVTPMESRRSDETYHLEKQGLTWSVLE